MRINLAPIALALVSATAWGGAVYGIRATTRALADTSYTANAGILSGWRARHEHGRAGLAGGVTCHDGKPHVEPPDPSLTGRALDENALHELMHQQQFEPGCDSIMAIWNSVPFYRLELEAQATCFGLAAWPEADRGIRKGLAARRISAAYGNVVGFEDVYAALDRWCIAADGPKP